jgi:hypothetical protein
MVQESDTGANIDLLLPNSRLIVKNNRTFDARLAGLSLYSC